MAQDTSTDVQLGELLIQSGLIEPDQFDAAYRLSFKMRLPLGRVLAMHGHVAEEHLRATIEVQARVRDGLIPFDHAVQALNAMAKDGISLDKAINRMGAVQEAQQPKVVLTQNRLGELLMQSGLVTKEQVNDAMLKSGETGLPLGMILINNGVLSRAALNSALCAQRLIRDGKVDRTKALYALKMARMRSISLAESLQENADFDPNLMPGFGFGELFVLAGVVSESQLLTARELEVTKDFSIEQVFVQLGYASVPCVKAANHILNMIKQGILFEDQAAQIIKSVQYASSNEELQLVLNQIDSDPEMFMQEEKQVDITEILKKSGLISDKDIQIATALALANKVPLLKTLYDAKLIDEAVTHYAQELKMYLDHDLLSLEQANIVISYCLENQMTVEETLELFGWTAPGT